MKSYGVLLTLCAIVARNFQALKTSDAEKQGWFIKSKSPKKYIPKFNYSPVGKSKGMSIKWKWSEGRRNHHLSLQTWFLDSSVRISACVWCASEHQMQGSDKKKEDWLCLSVLRLLGVGFSRPCAPTRSLLADWLRSHLYEARAAVYVNDGI